MTTPTVTLEDYRALAADARAALRMIREVVEQKRGQSEGHTKKPPRGGGGIAQ